MGARLVKFEICPKENEQLEVTVKVPEERRSVIHGIVKNCKDEIIKDAVVKLFEINTSCKPCTLKPITHTFTDECGQFIFGPLCPHKKYLVKVWYNDVTITPLTIKDECPPSCKHHCDNVTCGDNSRGDDEDDV